MKKAILVLIGVIIISFLITSISGKSVIFDSNEKTGKENIECINGNINPFKGFNFDSDDNWKLYIVFKGNDLDELSEGIKKANYLYTSDKEHLKNIKNRWDFKCTEGDMATVESRIVLLKNGNNVFQSGIVVNDNRSGLQSKNFGWVESNIILEDLKFFKRSYSPIIFP